MKRERGAEKDEEKKVLCIFLFMFFLRSFCFLPWFIFFFAHFFYSFFPPCSILSFLYFHLSILLPLLLLTDFYLISLLLHAFPFSFPSILHFFLLSQRCSFFSSLPLRLLLFLLLVSFYGYKRVSIREIHKISI